MHTLQQLRSGEFKDAKHLRLSEGLTEFPEEIFQLAGTLEILDLSVNKLRSLPADFGKLSRLKILFMSDNLFTELPPVLSACPALEMIGFKANSIENVPEPSIPETTRWLILTNNRITSLPASIGNCSRLQKVALAGNKLAELPAEMAQCRNIELLRISANQLTALPEWLFDLPKLSWLAFSGNPLSDKQSAREVLQEISWKDFEILEQLGEGASGNIYRALRRIQNTEEEVAIKIFKGEVTSDGLPADEMNAAILAGLHPNFPVLVGTITGHPKQKQGLVMSLIPSLYKNLGWPPSFETCTRDVFPAGTTFRTNDILKIVKAACSVLLHLHRLGIMHGDFYAHNTLVDAEKNTLFTDFGAATIYAEHHAHAKQFEQIDVRAFGCLLDDLLALLSPLDADGLLADRIRGLRDELLSEKIASRPLFKEIENKLAAL